jgi:hypothetical protein
MKKITTIILSVLVLAGCANPYASMRDGNRAALNKIELGMSKIAVVSVMGERSAEGQGGRYENPYKRETIKGTDGNTYEILYYYTQEIGERPIETGLTPIVLSSGKVVGIGWGYLDSIAGNSTSTIRRR